MIDYLGEVAHLCHLSREEAERRAGQGFHHQLIAEEWERQFGKRDPTEGELILFYCTSEGVLWDSVGWVVAQQGIGWPALVVNLQRREGFRAALDYGCGLAPCSLQLAANGCDVTLADIPTLVHRMILPKLVIRYPTASIVQPMQIPKVRGLYDAIICTEVLEHLWEPELAMRQMVEWLKPQGVWIGSWSWGAGDNPLHLKRNEVRYHRDLNTWPGIMRGMGLGLESDLGNGLMVWRKRTQ